MLQTDDVSGSKKVLYTLLMIYFLLVLCNPLPYALVISTRQRPTEPMLLASVKCPSSTSRSQMINKEIDDVVDGSHS